MKLSEMMFRSGAKDPARIVTLSEIELEFARIVGLARREESRKSNRAKGEGDSGKANLDTDVQGAEAEIAAAKFLNFYWAAHLNEFKAADLNGTLQVKSTDVSDGHLIVRPDDNLNHTAVLVVCCRPCYYMAGHIKIADAHRQEWWDNICGRKPPGNGNPAWWVPQASLQQDGWMIV